VTYALSSRSRVANNEPVSGAEIFAWIAEMLEPPTPTAEAGVPLVAERAGDAA
jgi:hypothetical protein